jgi:hypothetical protein
LQPVRGRLLTKRGAWPLRVGGDGRTLRYLFRDARLRLGSAYAYPPEVLATIPGGVETPRTRALVEAAAPAIDALTFFERWRRPMSTS